ncbi:MAG: ABC transporter permease [Thermoleophilaceae bacterium]
MEGLIQDLGYALRSLRKTPGFTAVAVLTLALGIGANTAIFSVVSGVLLDPLPYANPDRLVFVFETDRDSGTQFEGASIPDFFDFRERSSSFDALATYRISLPTNLTREGGEPQRLNRVAATHDLFSVLGVEPLLGRTFAPEEDRPGGSKTALLSEELWRSAFGADPEVIGRTVRLDDETHTVIGVMPSSFAIPSAQTDLWTPLQAALADESRGTHNVVVVGRLADGVTAEQAQAEMTRIMAQLEAEYPEENQGRGAFIEPLGDALFGPVHTELLVLLGAVALVLLIACGNVANLLLARSAARARETAVRKALGAGLRRLARQFLGESLILVGIAATLGVLLAVSSLELLLALAPADIPRIEQVGIDGRVLAFTVAVSVLVGLIFGFVPLVQGRHGDLQSALKEEGGRSGSASHSRQRMRGLLIVSEVALAGILLVGAGLLLQSFWRLQQVDPGFNPENLVKLDFVLPESRYPQGFDDFPNWPDVQGFHAELLDRVRRLPGVRSAALAQNDPLAPGWTVGFGLEGQTAEEIARQPEVRLRIVSPDYLRTVGVPLLRGRRLAERDRPGEIPAVMINEALARRYFPDRDPIGTQLTFWDEPREIVGIVGNEKFFGLGEETPPAIYPALAQMPFTGLSLLVGTATPEATLTAVRSEIRSMDPDLALFNAGTMEQVLFDSVAQPRFMTLLMGLFAALALVLAVVGVHGVLSYTVAQRTREVGIRMALGASRRAVVGMVVAQGLTMTGIGIAIAVLGAFLLTRFLSSQLFQVTTTDPLAFSGMAVGLAVVATLASYFPARRAAQVDPMVALRNE